MLNIQFDNRIHLRVKSDVFCGYPVTFHLADYGHCGSKRRLISGGGPCEGRRHLYCMRSASVKSLRHQQINGGGGTLSGTGAGNGECCSRVHRMRQQMQLQQQGYVSDNESRRKSLSQPSLRITEAGLRR